MAAPKFRPNGTSVRDSKQKDKATTLARKQLRADKYESAPAVVRVTVSA
ncbi:hypothetical protein [Streptomyces sp. NPDC092295]